MGPREQQNCLKLYIDSTWESLAKRFRLPEPQFLPSQKQAGLWRVVSRVVQSWESLAQSHGLAGLPRDSFRAP